MGASAAPCSADFDPPRRTAPAERGPRAALRPRPFPACGGGLPDHRPRVTGGGGRSRVGGHCFLALPLAVYVFSWEPSVWSGACIGGGGGGTSAPGAVTSTGRRPGASEAGLASRPPAAQLWSALETFVRRPLDQFFASSGASLPPPIPAHSPPQGRVGGRAGVGGPGTRCASLPWPPRQPRAGPLAPSPLAVS